MNVEFLKFADAVEKKRPKHFFAVGPAPTWLKNRLSHVSAVEFDEDVFVLLSSETAEVKLRKHFIGGNVAGLVGVIACSLACDTPVICEGKFANSIEVYFEMNQELWLVVFKSTELKEIIVKTVHRTDNRNLQTARRKRLLSRAHE